MFVSIGTRSLYPLRWNHLSKTISFGNVFSMRGTGAVSSRIVMVRFCQFSASPANQMHLEPLVGEMLDKKERMHNTHQCINTRVPCMVSACKTGRARTDGIVSVQKSQTCAVQQMLQEWLLTWKTYANAIQQELLPVFSALMLEHQLLVQLGLLNEEPVCVCLPPFAANTVEPRCQLSALRKDHVA